jgi:uncharacterized membrane protein
MRTLYEPRFVWGFRLTAGIFMTLSGVLFLGIPYLWSITIGSYVMVSYVIYIFCVLTLGIILQITCAPRCSDCQRRTSLRIPSRHFSPGVHPTYRCVDCDICYPTVYPNTKKRES